MIIETDQWWCNCCGETKRKRRKKTKQNTETRWREHCSTKKTSEVGDHPLLNPGDKLSWEILTNALNQVNKRKKLEAFCIRTLQPSLNNQLNTKRTLLFRNGITWLPHEWLIFIKQIDFYTVFNLYAVFSCNIFKSFLTWRCRYTTKSFVIFKMNILWFYILCSSFLLIDQWRIMLLR